MTVWTCAESCPGATMGSSRPTVMGEAHGSRQNDKTVEGATSVTNAAAAQRFFLILLKCACV